MSFGSRLKEKRESLGITQPQLAEILGVSKGAIGNWETDVNSPRATLLYDLFEILQCDANYLFQDETRELYKNKATPDEFENIIKKYRELDIYGQETVSYILDREAERIKTHGKITDHRVLNLIELSPATDKAKTLPYWQEGAAAGSGIYQLNDTECIRLKVIDTPVTRQADFIINVSGRSMEPDYHDGDRVLVSQKDVVQLGEVGIFIKNGKSYIKELGTMELISRNPASDNIPVNEFDNVVCMGKVIGKVTDDMIIPD